MKIKQIAKAYIIAMMVGFITAVVLLLIAALVVFKARDSITQTGYIACGIYIFSTAISAYIIEILTGQQRILDGIIVGLLFFEKIVELSLILTPFTNESICLSNEVGRLLLCLCGGLIGISFKRHKTK